MHQPTEFMDVADSDFLSNKELDDDDSEFDSEFEKYFVFSSFKNRMFGRKRPLHVVLGSGKIADILLWRDKQISASILAGVTLIWILFKNMDYTLLSFICDSLILLLAVLFLWTHLTSFINISTPKLSALILPEGLLVNAAISMTNELNQLLITFGVLASGRDLKKFLLVTVTLGAVSVLGTWFTAATLFYIVSVILLIVPAVYERHEDIINIIAEKAFSELNNRYAELMKKFFRNSQPLQDSILE
ncbi:reticulon-like protein B5 [Gastrolobium bilobum]|uniref:reticulon-like protein B5 n=1 Tax=Gastrolobium bilobum TaxID=150636 RepID=UPI002AB01D5F|nr:reticulon-like protein B5 [Gastrolobium bilobum]